MRERRKKCLHFIMIVVIALAVTLFSPSPFPQRTPNKPQTVSANAVAGQGQANQLIYAYSLNNGQVKDLGVKGAILVDYDTGQVLYGLHEHTPLPPASITKLMTLYTTLEKIQSGEIQWDDPVTVSEKAAGINEAQVYLKKGEVLSLRDMVKAMVVASANDAAVTMRKRWPAVRRPLSG